MTEKRVASEAIVNPPKAETVVDLFGKMSVIPIHTIFRYSRIQIRGVISGMLADSRVFWRKQGDIWKIVSRHAL